MTTQAQRLSPFSLRVLRVLLELARHDRPAHAGAIARELRAGRTLVADSLVRLDRAGLVRAEHARLTMQGLVLASRLRPHALRAPSLLTTPHARRALSAGGRRAAVMRATGS
jgi:Mn-dependent DtxR family transcriptional regulator